MQLPGLAISLAVLAAAAAPQPWDNLLANPSFETAGAENMPAGWHQMAVQVAEGLTSAARVRGGRYGRWCLMMEGKGRKIADFRVYCQPAELPPDATEYVFSCYVATAGIPEAEVRVTLFSKDFADREWKTPPVQWEQRPIPTSRGFQLLAWRFEALPGARQAVVSFHIHGQGRLYVDQVSLRRRRAILTDLLCPGIVTTLRGRRICKISLKSLGWGGDLLIQAAADIPRPRRRRPSVQSEQWLYTPRVRKTLFARRIQLAPNQQSQVEIPYGLSISTSADMYLRLLDAKTGDVLDAIDARIPALIDGHLTAPAFRNTVLRSMQIDTIRAEGILNADSSLASQLTLSAVLLGTRAAAQPGRGIEMLPGGRWRLELPAKNLLADTYQLAVSALLRGREVARLSIPLVVAEAGPCEVGYDASGCLYVSGRPVFIRGMYGIAAVEELEDIAAAGFNCAVASWGRAATLTLRRAHDLGVWIIVLSRSMERSFWQHATDKYADHPALLAWHTVPRADVDLSTLPFMLEDLHTRIAAYDPRRPLMTSLCAPSAMPPYSRWLDIVVAWTDPIPDSTPAAVGVIIDGARKAAPGKPVWAAIQTVGHHWSQNRMLNPQTDGRCPTPQELRCMTFLALIHGARGLLFHSYAVDRRLFPPTADFKIARDAPSLWAELLRTNKLLSDIERFLTIGQWKPIDLSRSSQVHSAYWLSGGDILCIVANTSPKPAVAAFRIPEAAGKTLRNIESGQLLKGSDDGLFGDMLKPLEVKIYRSVIAAE